MTLPRWLDRLWLGLIAVAALVMIPIWFILSIQRYGALFVCLSVAVALYLRWTATSRSH